MTKRSPSWPALVAVIAAAAVTTAPPYAQQPGQQPAKPAPAAASAPKLSAVLSAFLAEASAPSRAVAWTAGNELPVKWETRGPVPIADYLKGKGLTQSRTGSARVMLVAGAPKDVTLLLHGNAAGIQKVIVGLGYDGNGAEPEPMERIGRGLAADGVKLGFLKCRREGEGVTGGNVAYLLEAPGRKPAALIEYWSCSHDGACGLELTLLDPKADLSDVECHG